MKYINFLSRAVRREKPTMSEVIGDLHHGVIWLLLRTSYVLPESFTFSFSYANWGICHLNPTGLQSLNNREKTKESPQVLLPEFFARQECFALLTILLAAMLLPSEAPPLNCKKTKRWNRCAKSCQLRAGWEGYDVSSVYPFIVFIKSHLIGMFRILVSSCIWRLKDSTMSAKDKTKTKINKQNQT